MKKLLLLSLFLCGTTAIQAAPHTSESTGIAGDTNNNGIISVADVVTQVNHILEIPISEWNDRNADINKDGAVTVSDISSIVDIILRQADYSGLENGDRSITKISDRLISDNFKVEGGETTINVRLDNSKVYSAIQAEVTLPEDMELTEIRKGPRAASQQLLYNVTERGTVKLVIFSFTNSPFLEDTQLPLFTIACAMISSTGNINIGNIIAANSDSYNYELGFSGGLNTGDTTGLAGNGFADVAINPVREGVEILNAAGQTVNVFTVGGELFKTVVAAADYEMVRLAGGIYIVTVGNRSAKVNVR